MTTGSTLACRMLCASGAAYTIIPDEKWSPPTDNIFFQGSGFFDDTVALVAGELQTNACLVGENEDGVVVAFRGTLGLNPPTWAALWDWVVNDISIQGPMGRKH